jgi:hypothetical protein
MRNLADYLGNIRKCAAHGFDRILCAVTRRELVPVIAREATGLGAEIIYVRDLFAA